MDKLIPVERIENRILLIRGQKVMLDKDLADLYGVQTSRLNEAVKRNIKRFPDDFMFQLTDKEAKNLMSQFAISSWGGYRKLPYAFTEQGIAMLSSVLSSDHAIEMNILIMRAFVKLRRILTTHKGLAQKIEELEKKYSKHEIEISIVFKLLKQLMGTPSTPEKPKKRIGFIV
ncbi:ORF6N domain-containing protein [Candidatus Saganbacteria bacterium]|nr:ORF6N domain-containing protein [Candidatus Saganbacteria bacterium]